jgi:hypothetical protein
MFSKILIATEDTRTVELIIIRISIKVGSLTIHLTRT